MNKKDILEQSEFPLFNETALKSSVNTRLNSFEEKNGFIRSNDGFFNKKINLDQNNEILTRKRARKSKNNSKTGDDSKVTIKEIIEDQYSGEPTEKEKKMREERLKKMREKRIEKKMLKSSDQTHGESPQKEAIIHEQAKNEIINLSNSSSHPKENVGVNVSRITIVNGKTVLEINPETLQENKFITLGTPKNENTTSASFKHRNHTEKWSPEETKKFYKAIEIFGSDFSMIAKLFPSRNRAQIKNKYRKEEKEKPDVIDTAFKRHRLSDKLRLKERISDLNSIMDNQNRVLSLENSEKNEELKRNLSNSSTDSMDMKIIDDLQTIFQNEAMKLHAKESLENLRNIEENKINLSLASATQAIDKSQESINTMNLLSNL